MNERVMKGTGILQAMLTLDFLSVATLLATIWAVDNPDPSSSDPVARHIAWGLGATMINLVARCVAIFYMLASGRSVKDLVAEFDLDPTLIRRSKGIKRGVETLATVALVPVMWAAMNGGAVGESAEARGDHVWWAWTAVVFAILCLLVDVRAGMKNYRLLREVDALSHAAEEKAATETN